MTRLEDVGERQSVTIQLLSEEAGLLAGMSSSLSGFSFGAEANVEAAPPDGPTHTNVVEGPKGLAHYVNVFDQQRYHRMKALDAAGNSLRSDRRTRK
ncbi:hypothetical protein ACJ6WD_04815 [Streptomyces sp. VTCC 41912]|uniref:hypothetical protein n=1 Tax=Streptomyces sp. VTCC 41912 TaxID=3383243 RepID=UPI003896EE26